MKKLAATFLLTLYFTMSAGATIHLHYCMGEYVGFSFSGPDKQACSKCGMSQHDKSSNNCCKDVKITPKITDKHTVSFFYVSQEASFLILHPDFPQIKDDILLKVPIITALPHHPPGKISQPLYLQLRNIRV